MTIMSTVGFGDIAATTNAARITVMLQMAGRRDRHLVVVARLMVNSVRLHTGRRTRRPRRTRGRSRRTVTVGRMGSAPRSRS